MSMNMNMKTRIQRCGLCNQIVIQYLSSHLYWHSLHWMLIHFLNVWTLFRVYSNSEIKFWSINALKNSNRLLDSNVIINHEILTQRFDLRRVAIKGLKRFISFWVIIPSFVSEYLESHTCTKEVLKLSTSLWNYILKCGKCFLFWFCSWICQTRSSLENMSTSVTWISKRGRASLTCTAAVNAIDVESEIKWCASAHSVNLFFPFLFI